MDDQVNPKALITKSVAAQEIVRQLLFCRFFIYGGLASAFTVPLFYIFSQSAGMALIAIFASFFLFGIWRVNVKIKDLTEKYL